MSDPAAKSVVTVTFYNLKIIVLWRICGFSYRSGRTSLVMPPPEQAGLNDFRSCLYKYEEEKWLSPFDARADKVFKPSS